MPKGKRTVRSSDFEIPSWALAILFWRKVLRVESRGVPGSRNVQNGVEGSKR
jgi:hypothetical protein